MTDDRWLERLAAATEPESDGPERAPARLKAKIYSALMKQVTAAGPLLSLEATRTSGSGLCVFEQALAALPAGERIGSMNPCRICHARVLAEHLEHAPIYWPNCPYAAFHHGSRE
jgi:hypothetical protein